MILYFPKRSINTSKANNNITKVASGGKRRERACAMHDQQVAESVPLLFHFLLTGKKHHNEITQLQAEISTVSALPQTSPLVRILFISH